MQLGCTYVLVVGILPKMFPAGLYLENILSQFFYFFCSSYCFIAVVYDWDNSVILYT